MPARLTLLGPVLIRLFGQVRAPRPATRLAVLTLVVGCAPSTADSRANLAEGFQPAAIARKGTWARTWCGQAFRLEATRPDGRQGFAVRFGRDLWFDHGERLWSAPLPFPGMIANGEPGTSFRLEEAALPVLRVPAAARGALSRLGREPLPSGLRPLLARSSKRPAYFIGRERVFLLLGDDPAPPEHTLLRAALPLGAASLGVWRLTSPALVADGLPVLRGRPVERGVTTPEGGHLSFFTSAIGSTDPLARARVTFRVRAGEKVLFEHEQDATSGPPFPAHRIPLPAGKAKLTFEVTGDVAFTSFLAPRAGLDARDADPRPDIVLLLADTYRADNLAAWGGDPAWTPRLNDLAGESVRFLRARAASTWTLPSHAALMSGLYPPQAGISGKEDRLGEGAVTLAEVLREGGYRTVAVTDRGFVSRSFGLAQGFEWFEEDESREFERSLATLDELLQIDDGRPLFLFVQSYRAHEYLDPEERVPGGVPDLVRRTMELVEETPRGTPVDDTERLMAGRKAAYRRAATALDEGFGRILELLAEHGVDRGLVVFTSDHGEAFGEHGVQGHGSGVWDGQAHVPLTFRAPDLDPGEDLGLVSLVDLAPTIVRYAALEAPSSWVGADLLGDGRRSTAMVFQSMAGSEEEAAVIQGRRKFIMEAGDGPGDLRFAYDLELDPEELVDRASEAELLEHWEELRAGLAPSFAPRISGREAEVSTSLEHNLRELGYLGDDER